MGRVGEICGLDSDIGPGHTSVPERTEAPTRRSPRTNRAGAGCPVPGLGIPRTNRKMGKLGILVRPRPLPERAGAGRPPSPERTEDPPSGLPERTEPKALDPAPDVAIPRTNRKMGRLGDVDRLRPLPERTGARRADLPERTENVRRPGRGIGPSHESGKILLESRAPTG
jgi:hypothetical protein